MVMRARLPRRAGNLQCVGLPPWGAGEARRGPAPWGGPASLGPGRSRLASAPPEPGVPGRGPSLWLPDRVWTQEPCPARRGPLSGRICSVPLHPSFLGHRRRERTLTWHLTAASCLPCPSAARGHPISPSPFPGMWTSWETTLGRLRPAKASSRLCSAGTSLARVFQPLTHAVSSGCAADELAGCPCGFRSCVVQTHKPFGPSVFVSEVLSL